MLNQPARNWETFGRGRTRFIKNRNKPGFNDQGGNQVIAKNVGEDYKKTQARHFCLTCAADHRCYQAGMPGNQYCSIISFLK